MADPGDADLAERQLGKLGAWWYHLPRGEERGNDHLGEVIALMPPLAQLHGDVVLRARLFSNAFPDPLGSFHKKFFDHDRRNSAN